MDSVQDRIFILLNFDIWNEKKWTGTDIVLAIDIPETQYRKFIWLNYAICNEKDSDREIDAQVLNWKADFSW